MFVYNNEEDIDKDINNTINLELWGITLSNPVQDPFAEQESYIKF
jgi:hypothetical protein